MSYFDTHGKPCNVTQLDSIHSSHITMDQRNWWFWATNLWPTTNMYWWRPENRKTITIPLNKHLTILPRKKGLDNYEMWGHPEMLGWFGFTPQRKTSSLLFKHITNNNEIGVMFTNLPSGIDKHSRWTWPLMVKCPITHGDFPYWFNVGPPNDS